MLRGGQRQPIASGAIVYDSPEIITKGAKYPAYCRAPMQQAGRFADVLP
jgi:hypothetical protein